MGLSKPTDGTEWTSITWNFWHWHEGCIVGYGRWVDTEL